MTQTVAVTAEINKESAAGKLVERKKSVAARDMMSRDDIRKSGGGATSRGRASHRRQHDRRRPLPVRPRPRPPLRQHPVRRRPPAEPRSQPAHRPARHLPVGRPVGDQRPEDRHPRRARRLRRRLGAAREPRDPRALHLQIAVGQVRRQHGPPSFQSGLRGDRFFGDGFAFGNLARGLPSSSHQPHPIASIYKPTGSLENFYSPKQIEQFGESMPSTRTAISDTTKALPNANFQRLRRQHLQAVGHRARRVRGGQLQQPASDPAREGRHLRQLGRAGRHRATRDVDYEGLKTTDNVQLSGSARSAGSSTSTIGSAFSTFYTRDADREARLLSGFVQSTTDTIPVLNTRLRYIMRSILFTRLGGKHEIPAREGAHDRMVRLLRAGPPGRPAAARDAVSATTPTAANTLDQSPSPASSSSSSSPTTPAPAASTSPPLQAVAPARLALQVRRLGRGQAPHLRVRTFDFEPRPNIGAPRRAPATSSTRHHRRRPAGQGGTEPFVIKRVHPRQDSYTGNQRVLAGYAMLDLPMVRWLRVVGGARFEANDIRVSPFDIFGRPRSRRTPARTSRQQRPPVGEPDLLARTRT
jgi:hypothetical protein